MGFVIECHEDTSAILHNIHCGDGCICHPCFAVKIHIHAHDAHQHNTEQTAMGHNGNMFASVFFQNRFKTFHRAFCYIGKGAFTREWMGKGIS